MKYYNVWLEDANLNRYEMFNGIEYSKLEDWLFDWARLEDGTWWIDGTSGAIIDGLNIPCRSMGYIVKFQKI